MDPRAEIPNRIIPINEAYWTLILVFFMTRYKDLKLKNLKKERKKIKLIKHIIQYKLKILKFQIVI